MIPEQSPLGQVLCAQSSLLSQCFNVESETDKCRSSIPKQHEGFSIADDSDQSLRTSIWQVETTQEDTVLHQKKCGQGPTCGRKGTCWVLSNCSRGSVQVAKKRRAQSIAVDRCRCSTDAFAVAPTRHKAGSSAAMTCEPPRPKLGFKIHCQPQTFLASRLNLNHVTMELNCNDSNS